MLRKLGRTVLVVVTCSLSVGTACAELQNVQVGSGSRIISTAEEFARALDYEKYATPLFNGIDLSGWWIRSDNEAGFKVNDGKLVVTGEGTHDWIFTDKEYGTFILGYDYRCVSGNGDSGVGIRVAKDGNPSFTGMEIQVIRRGWPVDWQRACALYSTVWPAVEADYPLGKWNSVRVICFGNQIQTVLNGQVLYSIDTNNFTHESTRDVDWQQPLADRRKRGHIAIQNHGDGVEFRNIKIVDVDTILKEAAEATVNTKEEYANE